MADANGGIPSVKASIQSLMKIWSAWVPTRSSMILNL